MLVLVLSAGIYFYENHFSLTGKTISLVKVGSQREKFTVENVYDKMNEFHEHFVNLLTVRFFT